LDRIGAGDWKERGVGSKGKKKQGERDQDGVEPRKLKN